MEALLSSVGTRRRPPEQTRLLPGLSRHRCLHRPHLRAGVLQAVCGRQPQPGAVHRRGDGRRLVIPGGGQGPVRGSRGGERHAQDVLQRRGGVAGSHREVCVLRWI